MTALTVRVAFESQQQLQQDFGVVRQRSDYLNIVTLNVLIIVATTCADIAIGYATARTWLTGSLYPSQIQHFQGVLVLYKGVSDGKFR
ncbi:hypothetical protein IQ228_06885 [Dolichospermum sp. LEGE 00246]|nr:hypothetical protein [Dolichospermum sp. LEGE 00246]